MMDLMGAEGGDGGSGEEPACVMDKVLFTSSN